MIQHLPVSAEINVKLCLPDHFRTPHPIVQGMKLVTHWRLLHMGQAFFLVTPTNYQPCDALVTPLTETEFFKIHRQEGGICTLL